jgi:hypothetical protein
MKAGVSIGKLFWQTVSINKVKTDRQVTQIEII